MFNHPVYTDVSSFIQNYDSLHFTFLKLQGRCQWLNSIKTAQVEFDCRQKPLSLSMSVNQTFWKRLNFLEKAFVFTHEMLHILLLHPQRGHEFFKHLENDQKSHKLLNICMDICVNRIAKDHYFKDKPLAIMPLLNDLCWIDTVFKAEDLHLIESGKDFSYYYLKFIELYGIEAAKDLPEHFDEHVQGSDSINNSGNVTGYSDEELKDIEDIVNEVLEHKDFEDILEEEQQKANGYSESSALHNGTLEKQIQREKSLDDLFNLTIKTAFIEDKKIHRKTNWYGVNKRTHFAHQALAKDLNIPVSQERIKKVPKVHRICLYLDVSGSCTQYSQKMANLAFNLPEEKYKIEAYVFADRVGKVNKTTQQNVRFPNVGWGTSISSVIRHYNELIKKENEQGFDAVFIVTDGGYTYIRNDDNELYKNWHFFMVPHYEANYFKKSKMYMIKKI